MNIFSTIKQNLKTTQQKIVSALTPSPEVSAQRRLNTFGSTSKVKAGAIIGGAAAVAIVAPIVATSAAARTAIVVGAKQATSVLGKGALQTGSNIVKAIGNKFVTSPIPTTLGVLIGTPIVAGIIKENPKAIVTLPKQGFNIGTNIGKFINENPKTSALIGAGGALSAALLIAKGTKDEIINNVDIPQILPINKTIEQETQKENKNEVIATNPVPPLAQETQKLTKTTTKKRKYKKKVTSSGLQVKVINVNNSRIQRSTNYLNTKDYRMLQ